MTPRPKVEPRHDTPSTNGSGTTVAVRLHQIDAGPCGFLSYADYLAGQKLQTLAFDQCRYGQAGCPPELTENRTGQVELVVQAAQDAGAERVVLVGASMGGSLAVTAAQAVRADAIIDLSGPATFADFNIASDARNVSMPALFAYSNIDRADLDADRAQLSVMPTKQKTLLTFDSRHEYELLRDSSTLEPTALARRVAIVIRNP